jgi:WD40 repeat protein
MAAIRDKATVARCVKRGLDAISDQLQRGATTAEEVVARRLAISPRTLQSWAYRSNMPNSIEDAQLLGLAWLVVFDGHQDLAWLIELLRATSIIVLDLPTPEWARACFASARLDGRPLSEEQITQVVTALFGTQRAASGVPAPTQERIYWSEPPVVSACYGRQDDLDQLQHWMLDLDCQLIAVVGMGGIGKTTVTVKLVEQIKQRFDCVYWQSLREPLALADLLADWISFLSGAPQPDLAASVDKRITILIEILRVQHCLLVLDNFEAVLREGDHGGQYRVGYEGYGDLIRRVGGTRHASCLLLTSWERPKEFAVLESTRATAQVRSYQLDGLAHDAAQQILKDKGLQIEEKMSSTLIERCSGNPSALEEIAARIRDVFGGDAMHFLRNEEPIFEGVRSILNQQFARLSDLERTLIYWLAIEREATSPTDLRKHVLHPLEQRNVINGLASLQRRLLIETSRPGFFRLHNVILEYATDQLVTQVSGELETGNLALFKSHALIQAQAKDQIREKQIRWILKPIAEKSRMVFRTQEAFDRQLKAFLARLRDHLPLAQGYAGGNTLNLLVQLKHNIISNYDFSGLTIWQAYLRDAQLHNVNFKGALVEKSVFAETFGRIRSIVLSAQGGFLSAGAYGGRIHIWQSTPDGQHLSAVYSGHTDLVRSVAFHPDGQMLASGSADQTIRLWDVESGACLHVLHGHTAPVRSVAFHPDGQMLASGSADQTIRLWDVASGACLRVLHDHKNWVRSVAFRPDGQMLASGGADQTIRLWDVESGACLHVLHGHTAPVRSVAFHPDGQMLASGSADQTIRLWDIAGRVCVHILQGHTDRIRSVAFSSDGQVLASGSDDKLVKLWNVADGQCMATLRGHTNRIWSVTFGLADDRNILASAGDDQTIKLWDTQTWQCLRTLRGHTNRVRSIAFHPTGDRLASGAGRAAVRIWDTRSGRLLHTLAGHTGRVRSVCFNHTGSILATGSEDRTIKLWDTDSWICVKTLDAHASWVRAVAFSPNGQLLASGGDDETVKLWEVKTGRCRQTLPAQVGWVRAVAFSPDGQLLASSSNQTIQLWDVRTGHLLRSIDSHIDRVRAVVFSPDGRLLASCDGQLVRLWDVSTWECRHILHGHTGRVRAVAFSPDGQTLISGSDDETVKFWDTASGHCRRTLDEQTGWVWAVAFSPDGQTLVSGGKDESIQIWDTATGVCERVLESSKPYAGMIITAVESLTAAQKAVLIQLGAIE